MFTCVHFKDCSVCVFFFFNASAFLFSVALASVSMYSFSFADMSLIAGVCVCVCVAVPPNKHTFSLLLKTFKIGFYREIWNTIFCCAFVPDSIDILGSSGALRTVGKLINVDSK